MIYLDNASTTRPYEQVSSEVANGRNQPLSAER